METEKTYKNRLVIVIVFICFALTGMLALSTGSLMPFIRDRMGLDYKHVGTAVSMHAAGTLIAGFFTGILNERIGRKKTILFFTLFFPVAYILIPAGRSLFYVALAFFFLGLSRGGSSNFCNFAINSLAPGRASLLNGLHSMFSIGAFSFSLFLALLTGRSADNWVIACIVMTGLGVFSLVLYAFCPDIGVREGSLDKGRADGENPDKKMGFFKEKVFIAVTATLFFYMCAEAGVVGWMVTYFTDTGYISNLLAQLMASILWIMILAGRLTSAFLSNKKDRSVLLAAMGIGLVFFFTCLLFVRTAPLILICTMGFGFFMSGIFPTTLSFAGDLINRYSLAWSFILTLSGLGGIVMPMIVGRIAVKVGIAAGIASIAIAVAADLICIFSLKRISHNSNI